MIGAAVWVALLVSAPVRKPDWHLLPGALKGTIFLLCLVVCASMMPVEQLPPPLGRRAFGLGFVSVGLRQHPAHGAGAQAGRLRLGVLAYAVASAAR